MKPTMTKASSMSEEPVQARDVGGIQSGSCTPCIFWVSARGCARANCDFAHLRHHPKPEDYVRPRRAKRDAMKQTIFEHFLVPDEDDRHRLLQEEEPGWKTQPVMKRAKASEAERTVPITHINHQALSNTL
ncbi:unnamed protein product [Durusdinium trenchii]|uniref:Uncharacterized protein n=2 Tax=Durusdinium trenchii TaxID=1381693 RepID=A0ABP0QKT5_9DINO